MKKIITLLLLVAFVSSLSAQTIRRVSSTSTALTPTGSNWTTDAYSKLQDALAASLPGDEVWVKAGTYVPFTQPNSRNSSFNIPSDVRLYGGFSGTETSLAQRNISLIHTVNETILSGEDFSFNVVVFRQSSSPSTTLDGFWIRLGRGGIGTDPRDGAGILIDANGAGYRCSPQIANCKITECYLPGGTGAGVFITSQHGGYSAATFTNCTIAGNNAFRGGGVCINTYNGGNSFDKFINCSFTGNTADAVNGFGGAVYLESGWYGSSINNPNFTNCSFSGNKSPRGAVIFFEGGFTADETGIGILDMQNCVAWGNENNNEFIGYNVEASYDYCLIQGMDLTGGGGLNGTLAENDPSFVLQPDFTTAPTLTGNLQLQANSAVINKGNNIFNSTNTDLAGNQRKIGIIDMGAYEAPHLTKWYVDSSKITGPHAGGSWATAFNIFQNAVSVAEAGDTIFVAKGTYQAAAGFSIAMKDGVKIYGGFAGTETTLNERNLGNGYKSILKGNGSSVITNVGIDANARLDGFTITGGNAYEGGGINNISNSSPVIANCFFINNNAFYGGAVNNASGSSPLFINCVFMGNSATTVYFLQNINSAPVFTNCTITGNTNSGVPDGFAVYNQSNIAPVFNNCIIWNNTGGIYNSNVASLITYSIVQDGYTGTGNSSADPQFISIADADGPDDIFGTADDGIIPLPCSPAVNSGNNPAVPAGITRDIAWQPRISATTVDMGAYETLPGNNAIFYYRDADGDGHGDGNNRISVTCAPPAGYVLLRDDCNDNDASIYIGAPEVCDGKDNNCDGQIDEGVKTTYYRDSDGDGYGDAGHPIQNCSVPAGYVGNSTDCDDTRASVNPGAAEVCDGIDNNCNGQVDEGVKTTYYLDQDHDGYGNPNNSVQDCKQAAGYVTNNTDCDDSRATVHPGATEICGNGIDDNCDGQIDESCILYTFYADADADGYGNANSSTTNYTGIAPAGYVADKTDCDDTKATVNPDAVEICGNGIDDNCNGQIDEGCTIYTFYADTDADGYGNANSSITNYTGIAPAGYVADKTDCDDTKATVNPAAVEICGNGIDDNCDGQIDEGCILYTFYADADADGYGNANSSITNYTGIAPTGYVSDNTDCDDTKATVNPGAVEICGNGIDDNCNGQIDEGCTIYTFYADTDADGYGNLNSSVTNYTGIAPAGYVTDKTDCDDTKATVHPDATEICGNGIDDNCDGQIDEGCTIYTFYADTDADGYGNANSSTTNYTGIAPAGYVADKTDCDDTKATVHPGAVEICGNGIDDNCDGQVDEGCTTDVPKIDVSSTIVPEGNSGTTNAIFILTLSKLSKVPVTVQYKTQDGSATAPLDYIAKTGTVTFPANSLTQTVTIQVAGDLLNEYSETFKLLLSVPVNGTLGNAGATATITDNDSVPAIHIADTSATENSQLAKLRVSLTSPSGKTISVKYDSKDDNAKAPGDYTAVSNGSLSFLPGETVKYISIVIKKDNLNEFTEKFKLTLRDAVNASISNSGARKTAEVHILNSAVAASKTINTDAFDINPVAGLQATVSPNPSTNYFTINITAQASEPVLLIVSDLSGRVIEQRKIENKIQAVQIGNAWINGLYILELRQGTERKVFKLIKAQ